MPREVVERFIDSGWSRVEDYSPGEDFGIGDEYVAKFTNNDPNYHKGVFVDYYIDDLLIDPGENEFRVNDREASIHFEMGDRELALYADRDAARMIDQQQGIEKFLKWYEMPAAYQETFDHFEQ